MRASARASWPARPPRPVCSRRLDARGHAILNMFGMTEIGAAAVLPPEDPPECRARDVGRPRPATSSACAGDDRSVGELQVRGPRVTPGYYRRPEHDRGRVRRRLVPHRRSRPRSTPRAARPHLGRLKELIHVGGFNVFPAEVEGFLLTHPDVARPPSSACRTSAGRGSGGVRGGSRRAPSSTRRTSCASPAARIAGYKIPYAIEIVPEMPLLASGKPDRAALARRSR